MDDREEKDLFNKDVMYWREVNILSPNLNAQIEFIEPFEIDGDFTDKIACSLLPFESAELIYEMENGGAFKKTEVITWPFVLSGENTAFYKNLSNQEKDRNALVLRAEHSNIKSIRLIENDGRTVLLKEKI